MKKVSLIIALILITGLIFGCSKTTTPTTAPPVSETTKAPDASPVTSTGDEKAAAEAYVNSWIDVQKDLDQFSKDWEGLIASADKLDKAELKTKLDEQAKKYEAIKAKADLLKEKATTEDTKKHQEAIVEVITLHTYSIKANQDKYTKEGITPDEKTKLEATIKEKEDGAKVKTEEATKMLEDIKTKNEIKTEAGTTGGDTSASTATPADTGAPAASPTETTKE